MLCEVKLGVSIAVKTFGVCDFSRLAVTDWHLRVGACGFWRLGQLPLFVQSWKLKASP